MKKAINTQGIEVEVEDNVTTKTIDGIHYLLTEEELAAEEAKKQAWLAGSESRAAKATILKLEAEITPRRLREALLGTDNGWLANQESLIAIERSKL